MKRPDPAQSVSPESIQPADSADNLKPGVRAPEHRLQICGIPIDNVTEEEAIDRIEHLAVAGGRHYMVVVNAAKVVLASRDQELRSIIARADLVTADGMSVVWASRLLGQPLSERVTGIDIFEKLIRRAAQTGLSVFLLGASAEAVKAAARRFKSQHPDLRLAGYRDGYFDPGNSEEVAAGIRDTGADLLFVALGSPGQERWISHNLDRTGARFALGVGGAFDHLSGLAQRAPKWMQHWGLEWLYRFLREPARLWRRYLIGNPVFIWLVIRQRFSRNRR